MTTLVVLPKRIKNIYILVHQKGAATSRRENGCCVYQSLRNVRLVLVTPFLEINYMQLIGNAHSFIKMSFVVVG